MSVLWEKDARPEDCLVLTGATPSDTVAALNMTKIREIEEQVVFMSPRRSEPTVAGRTARCTVKNPRGSRRNYGNLRFWQFRVLTSLGRDEITSLLNKPRGFASPGVREPDGASADPSLAPFNGARPPRNLYGPQSRKRSQPHSASERGTCSRGLSSPDPSVLW